MISKLRGLLMTGIYRLLYGCKIRFSGIPSFRRGAGIKCKHGMIRTGKRFNMNTGSYCAVVHGGRLIIGDNVSINRNAMIICHDSITIGNGCSIAPNVLVYDHDHKFNEEGISSGFNTTPVIIDDNCWIGAGVIILRGTHIGEGCVIGAGCVVKGSVSPHSLVTSDRNLSICPINCSNPSRGD